MKYDLHYGGCTGAGETFNSHHGQCIIGTNRFIRSVSVLLKRLTLSGLIMGSRVDTAGDNQNPHVIICLSHIQRHF